MAGHCTLGLAQLRVLGQAGMLARTLAFVRCKSSMDSFTRFLNGLPDDQFLALYCAHIRDPRFVAAYRRNFQLLDLDLEYRRFLEAGNETKLSLAEFRALYESLDPDDGFSTGVVEDYKRAALNVLGADAQMYETIPVMMAPTRSVNGAAIKLPSGNAGIILHLGLPKIINCLLHLTWAAMTRGSAAPYSTFASAKEFCAAIADLSVGQVFPEAGAILKPSIQSSIMHHRHDPIFLVDTTLVSTLVTLHEYGHVALGHLKANGSDLSREERYASEIAADEFSFSVLNRHFPVGKIRWVATLFLRFVASCELVAATAEVEMQDTHPPGKDRLSALLSKHQADSVDPLETNLNQIFDYVDHLIPENQDYLRDLKHKIYDPSFSVSDSDSS